MGKTNTDQSQTNGSQEIYDREKELKAFDESKLGVKWVVDSGAKTVPKMFIRPTEELSEDLNTPCVKLHIPVINLADVCKSGCYDDSIVEQILSACGKWGFFRVVNHGIPLQVLDNLLLGIRRFHEQDSEAKKAYSNNKGRVSYGSKSNYDDHNKTKAVNWRDSFAVGYIHPEQLDPNEIPEICRDAIVNYITNVMKLKDILLELLSSSLKLRPSYLKEETECDKGWTLVNHYYPACPEPELTIGTTKHSDPSFLTILLQDHIGGLQVLYENQWVEVEPVHGAIVVNIGDILQMMSNDKFKSAYHRVKANLVGPRISSALFFNGIGSSPKKFGPIKELLTDEHPALYRDFTLAQFHTRFFSRSFDEPGNMYWKINNDGDGN